jgi:hypothetical protein
MQIVCPNCSKPVEVAKLARDGEVVCPSCGAGLRLEMEVSVSVAPVVAGQEATEQSHRRQVMAGVSLAAVVLLILACIYVVESSQQAARLAESLKESQRQEEEQRQQAEEKQHAARTAQQALHRQTLEANEGRAHRNLTEIQDQRTAARFGRSQAALDLIKQGAAVEGESREILDQLEDASDWTQRFEKFFAEHRPQLSREAVHWLATSSLLRVAELRFETSSRTMISSRGATLPAAAEVSPDGSLWARQVVPGQPGGRHQVEIADVASGQVVTRLDLVTDSSATDEERRRLIGVSLAFTVDGKQLLVVLQEVISTIGQDNQARPSRTAVTLEARSLPSGELVHRLPLELFARNQTESRAQTRGRMRVVFSPDRKRILIANGGPISSSSDLRAGVFDTSDGRRLFQIEPGLYPDGFTAQGDEIICTQPSANLIRSFVFLDVHTGQSKNRLTLDTQTVQLTPGSVMQGMQTFWPQEPCVSSDGRLLAGLQTRIVPHLVVLDRETGKTTNVSRLPAEAGRLQPGSLLCAIAPRANLLAVLSPFSLHVMSIVDGELLVTRPLIEPKTTEAPKRPSFDGFPSGPPPRSPTRLWFLDDQRIVTAGLDPQTSQEVIQFWDLAVASVESARLTFQQPIARAVLDASSRLLLFAEAGNPTAGMRTTVGAIDRKKPYGDLTTFPRSFNVGADRVSSPQWTLAYDQSALRSPELHGFTDPRLGRLGFDDTGRVYLHRRQTPAPSLDLYDPLSGELKQSFPVASGSGASTADTWSGRPNRERSTPWLITPNSTC